MFVFINKSNEPIIMDNLQKRLKRIKEKFNKECRAAKDRKISIKLIDM